MLLLWEHKIIAARNRIVTHLSGIDAMRHQFEFLFDKCIYEAILGS